MKDKPFALVGVHCEDTDPEGVRQKLRAESLPWRNAIEGFRREGLAADWNVRTFPAVFILDDRGVIRHRGLREAGAIERAVEELVAEVEGRRARGD